MSTNLESCRGEHKDPRTIGLNMSCLMRAIHQPSSSNLALLLSWTQLLKSLAPKLRLLTTETPRPLRRCTVRQWSRMLMLRKRRKAMV